MKKTGSAFEQYAPFGETAAFRPKNHLGQRISNNRPGMCRKLWTFLSGQH
ncbi:hypothetical protein [Nitratireductor soli]|nr:hypothetical protein [Nitratireductor soli]